MLKKHILFILVAILFLNCGKDEFFSELNDNLQLSNQQFWSVGRVVDFDGKQIWDSLSKEIPVKDAVLDSAEPATWFEEKLLADNIVGSHRMAPKLNKAPSFVGYDYFEGLPALYKTSFTRTPDQDSDWEHSSPMAAYTENYVFTNGVPVYAISGYSDPHDPENNTAQC